MQTLRYLCAVSGMIILLTSCATRTVVIDSKSDIVRLGANVKGDAYVWEVNKWVLYHNFQYPSGWYAGPLQSTNF